MERECNRMEEKYQRFAEMNEEKRDDIIRATLREFAIYPYNAASINRILANAGFSKGGLYHYFEGKKDLFIGVAEYILEYYYRERDRMMEGCSKDIFERLKECGYYQSIIGERYPYYAEFLCRIGEMKEEELTQELVRRRKEYEKWDQQFLFGVLDESLLKDGITKEEALLVIRSAVAGYQADSYLKGVGEADLNERHDHYADGLFELFEILRKILFK